MPACGAICAFVGSGHDGDGVEGECGVQCGETLYGHPQDGRVVIAIHIFSPLRFRAKAEIGAFGQDAELNGI